MRIVAANLWMMKTDVTQYINFPDALKETIEGVHGETGLDWLNQLPVLVNDCCVRWSLSLDKPFENLSYNFVIPGKTEDNQQVVLKLGVPCSELSSEATALRFFAGNGSVRLIEDDLRRGALLLERVNPGLPLRLVENDRDAARSAAKVMRALWRPVEKELDLVSVSKWFAAFERLRQINDGGVEPFPLRLIEKAEAQFHELGSEAFEEFVLHGDLHHENILSSERDDWISIDPKGVIGEASYEVGAYLRNNLPLNDSEKVVLQTLDARLAIFSDQLNLDRQRMVKWNFYQSVLAAIWQFEDGGNFAKAIQLAELMERV